MKRPEHRPEEASTDFYETGEVKLDRTFHVSYHGDRADLYISLGRTLLSVARSPHVSAGVARELCAACENLAAAVDEEKLDLEDALKLAEGGEV